MRKPLGIAVCTIAALGLLAGPGSAAPNLPEKPPRWEYAELYQRATARGFGPGLAKGDNEQPAAAPTAQPALRWVTADGEVEAKNWDELAAKLKAPAAKKEVSAAARKIQFLNHLGGEGWELVATSGGTTATSSAVWTFKRRLP
jgi:hypothetical protein